MVRLIFLVIFLTCIFLSQCQHESIASLKTALCTNDVRKIPLFATQDIHKTFDRAHLRALNIRVIHISTSINDRKVATFDKDRHYIDNIIHILNNAQTSVNDSTISYTLKVHAKYINRTLIHYSIRMIDDENRIFRINCSDVILITGPTRVIDKVFKGVVPFIITFISIQMGILLDLGVLKELIRRPIQILIGFVCQYGLMPLIAFSITKLFRYESLYGLGLFVVGCCPGGWASNQWTVLFDGDLNLSVFMSFSSTVASFFMMPFWLYTLGEHAYLRDLKIRIPFANLTRSLLTIIGPLGIGMLVVHCCPKIKPIVTRIVKPMLFILILYFFVFGAFVNFYLFRHINLRIALSAPLLPWLGFILGGIFAWIFRQDWSRIKTVGIETGIQNVGIAFMVLLYSFPAPENTQASVIPLIVAYLSAQPFYLILLGRFIYRKCQKPENPVRYVSDDTLSKTTRRLSEEGSEILDTSSPKRKPSIIVPVAGIAADSEPLDAS
ncbi:unnamed protein product [Adineta ricciae]|uniref:Uncharacterized protein n=1 Tax=Adineta ricciae TaxID=249248 RepID=A0A814QSP3_ADIRI|nr:unnamed protein product [Adineta ricciae]CAF1388072.1 unnamed protein product [Adineta ricciae]